MFAELAGGLSTLGSLGSLYMQNDARKDAKAQAERQRKLDLLNMIISIAGGRGPTGFTPEAALPQVNVGGALQDIGSAAQAYGNNQSEQAYRDAVTRRANADAARQEQYNMMSVMRNGSNVTPRFAGELDTNAPLPLTDLYRGYNPYR